MLSVSHHESSSGSIREAAFLSMNLWAALKITLLRDNRLGSVDLVRHVHNMEEVKIRVEVWLW